MHHRLLRLVALALVVLANAALLTSCEVPAALVVTTTVDGSDANPGDAICEATAGSGDCTLRAALDEANALGVADLTVPDGAYGVDHSIGPFLVAGNVKVNVGDPHAVTIGTDVWPGATILQIAAGGHLEADGLVVAGETIVEGGLAIRSSILRMYDLLPDFTPDSALTVEPTGFVILENVFVESALRPAVANEGTVHTRHATIMRQGRVEGSLVTLDNQGAGQVTLTSSAVVAKPLARIPMGVACAGTPPLSIGYNAASDATCSLSGTGDLTIDEAHIAGMTGVPLVTSPVVDAVPPGTNACGADVVTDLNHDPRPVDGNGDSLIGCDIGAVELPDPSP